MEEFKCQVLRITYDFDAGVGRVWFPEHNCCDMGGCIGFFEKIDKGVCWIATMSGDKEDMQYVKNGEKWEAFCKRDAA